MASPEWDAAFWDIGGVILDLESVQRAHARFVTTLVEDHDLSIDRNRALERWRTTVGDHFRSRSGTEFRAAREAYAEGVTSLVGERLEPTAWRPQFRSIVAETVQPVPGALETIEALADRSIHLGVISDVDDDEGRWLLEELGVRSAFDSITTSEQVGRTKPDPVIFETALETAGVPANRSIHVGDRYEHDMAGAHDIGLTTVAFGAEDGPAVDYRLESLRELIELLADTSPGTA